MTALHVSARLLCYAALGFVFATQLANAVTCGGTVNGSGIIQSPSYPSFYSRGINCTWTVQASSAASNIFLKIQAFSTEANYDILSIYSGGILAYQLSGSVAPRNLTLGYQANLIFVTNGTVNSTGFLVAVSTIAALSCGGTVNGNGIIQSPNYPNFYPRSINCTWTVQASSANGSIFLQIKVFSTEINYDILSIYSGGILAYKLSGSLAPQNLTLGYKANLTFVSKGSVNSTGFSAAVSTLPPVTCGGTVNGSGVIQSPNYPSFYPLGINCTWTVQASSTQGNIVLKIEAFSTELYADTVSIYSEGVLAYQFSGSLLPRNLTLRNQANLVFISNGSINNMGFSVAVSTAGASACVSAVTFNPLDSSSFAAGPATGQLAPMTSSAPSTDTKCAISCFQNKACNSFEYSEDQQRCNLFSAMSPPWPGSGWQGFGYPSGQTLCGR